MPEINPIQTPTSSTAQLIRESIAPPAETPGGTEMFVRSVAQALGGYVQGKRHRAQAEAEAEQTGWERSMELRTHERDDLALAHKVAQGQSDSRLKWLNSMITAGEPEPVDKGRVAPHNLLDRLNKLEAGLRAWERPSEWKGEWAEWVPATIADYLDKDRITMMEVYGGATLAGAKEDYPELKEKIERIERMIRERHEIALLARGGILDNMERDDWDALSPEEQNNKINRFVYESWAEIKVNQDIDWELPEGYLSR